MTEKIALAILDENQLQKELMHHQLELLRYEVFYSTMNTDELKKYFAQRPADVLLVNGENNLNDFSECIKNVRRRRGKLKVLFYNSPRYLKLEDEISKQKGTEVKFCMGGWANILTLLDSFSEPEPKPVRKEVAFIDTITQGSPFFKISENQKYMDILRYLKEGKSNRQIAYMLGTSIHNVKYYLKRMHDETGSSTIKMVADAIKAGII